MSGKPVDCSLDKVAFKMGHVIFPRCENKMKRLLILIVLVLAGCGDREPEQTPEDVIKEVHSELPSPTLKKRG